MGKKSAYLQELEKQYQKKHRLKLKLERELEAIRKGGSGSKEVKKKPELPMIEHPKVLLKDVPLPPKVIKNKVKKKKSKFFKKVSKDTVVDKEAVIKKKSEPLIDWSDLFRKKSEPLPPVRVIHQDVLKPKTLDETLKKPEVVKVEEHKVPKEFKEMEEVFKKYEKDIVLSPRERSLLLIGKVQKELKKGNLHMAEFFYKQIQPMYVKLTGYDRREVYNELVFLQNEFAMLKMKSFSKEVGEMPTRNYKLSTIMAQERKIDKELACDLMESEEERNEQEMEIDEMISKLYTHEEIEKERDYLRKIRDISMKKKRKKAREEAKEKKVRKEKLMLAKKKKAEKIRKEKMVLKKELELDKKITRKLAKQKKKVAKLELDLDKKVTKELVEEKEKGLKKVMKKELVVEKKVMKGLKKVEKLLEKAPLPPKNVKKKAKKKAKK